MYFGIIFFIPAGNRGWGVLIVWHNVTLYSTAPGSPALAPGIALALYILYIRARARVII